MHESPAIQRVGVVFRVSEVCGPEGASSRWPAGRLRRRLQFGSDRLDLGAGVADGFSAVSIAAPVATPRSAVERSLHARRREVTRRGWD